MANEKSNDNKKKYASLSTLSTFLTKLRDTFASLTHNHSFNDLEDKPFYQKDAFDDLSISISNPDNMVKTNSLVYDNAEKHCLVKVGELGDSSARDCILGISRLKRDVDEEWIDIDDSCRHFQSDGGAIMFDIVAIAAIETENATINTNMGDFTFPEAGVYVLFASSLDGSYSYYVDKIVFNSTIKTLDEKFIPDTIARTIDVDATVKDLKKSINEKASVGHNHDDRYYTETEIDSKLSEANTYANNAANAVKDDLLNGAGEAYDTLKELGALIDENTDAIDALESIASKKADAIHRHDADYYSKLEMDDKLSNKADKEHTHTVSDITDLTATATELNYMDGVTSNVQAQIDSKVSKDGDVMTGSLTTTELNISDTTRWASINLSGTGKNSGLFYKDTSDSHYGFRNTDTSSDYYEEFRIPTTVNLDKNKTYNILTEKSTVTIAQGGTGGTTVEEARENLGLEESIILGTVSASISTKNWHKVCYGGGKFVAIATSGEIAYSENAINWSLATLPSSGIWRGIAYGNGKFIVVGYNGTIAMYSHDGINWTVSTLPVNEQWYDVAFGNGKFIAISFNSANENSVAYSVDGINWGISALPTTYMQAVTYGNGKFVAVAYNEAIGAYSNNGIDWVATEMPSSADWNDVVYGKGKFVAITNNNNIAAYSEDGINWIQTTLPSSVKWGSLSYGNGVFVAIAYDSTITAYSTDGINWTQTTMPSSKKWNGVGYGNGKFVAVAYKDATIALSSDGINWSTSGQVLRDVNDTDITKTVKTTLGIADSYITHNDINNAIASAHNWTLIYDSGEIPNIANSISGIDISGYTNFEILVRCYNDGDSHTTRTGSAIFTAENGKTYQFPVWTNMFTKSISTASVMAQFKLIDGWLICPCASKLTGDIDIFDTTEGGTAGNLTPIGSGMMKCTSPLSTLTISNLDQNSDYYFGMGSRVMVWGGKI